MPALKLQEVWHSCFDSMILTDIQGEVLSLNRSARRLFSSDPGKLLGSSIFELIPSEELKKCCQTRTSKTGIALSLGTQQLIANILPVKISEDCVFLLLILKNITQIQLLHQQLQQMNEINHLYDTMLDQLDEGICVIDQQGKILFYNRKMGEIDVLEPEAVRGRRVTEVWSLDETASTLLTAFKTGKTLSQRETHFTRNGKAVTTLSRTIPLFLGPKKVGAMEIAKDITEQKKLTETIMHLQKQNVTEGTEKPSAAVKNSSTRFLFSDIVYKSREMAHTVEQARRAARSRSNILIVGETGTGKEMFAQSIHNESPRKHKPFIAQNCAALPESLLEGLLFGTTVGSFTGAVDRAGLFEQAHGGTLLLDEINSMGTDLQAKLLRVLQERKTQRLGSSKVVDVDVRVIATINEDPLDAIAKGRLREDLYYRLSVVHIVIPPLNSRKEDIPVLIDYFLKKHARALDVDVKGLDPDVYQFFLQYHWPGNVRQLEHTLEGALNLVYDEAFITINHLPPALKSKMIQQVQTQPPIKSPARLTGTLPEQIEQLERHLIEQALQEARGNITKASERLGISRQNLNYKLKKYNLLYPRQTGDRVNDGHLFR
ncbi:MAG: sigma 54-interacting transcriptional regulator [Brevibacillus sp.]|nr:sigma 54-interacting transcriptional regulator [Brevibacillus sp.]